MARIGVFICHCGTNIAGVLNLEADQVGRVTNADATGDVFTVVDPLITERGFYRVHHYRP